MIEYTQHSVAFPTLNLPHAQTDELHIRVSDDEWKEGMAELTIEFFRFDGGHNAVKVGFFSDSIKLFYDERVQRVMTVWGNQENPNEATVRDFINWFTLVGAVPSWYHEQGIKEAVTAAPDRRSIYHG